jgi:hypothetical protein
MNITHRGITYYVWDEYALRKLLFDLKIRRVA